MSITKFLLARIAEDEAVARAAAWVPDPDDVEDGLGDYGNPWATTHGEFASRGGPRFMHILHHAPAHVLAECVAKRQIIAEHREGRFFTVASGSGCRVCRTSDGDPDLFPCRTLRHLAGVYANHPDYQEWTIC